MLHQIYMAMVLTFMLEVARCAGQTGCVTSRNEFVLRPSLLLFVETDGVGVGGPLNSLSVNYKQLMLS